ncbi:secretin and TonB N-terminal domain-containing protein [Hydrogenophaga sp. T2]|uniref:secretin and TonB N-terminal domain-containing protein n=1 Tax=Hydrogenophaga sp. T2 TaxID=3132823 RepID=UPI003CEB57B4
MYFGERRTDANAWVARLALRCCLALPIGLSITACASYHNVVGKAKIAQDLREEGVQSLGVAAKTAPRDAEYQIDFLNHRDRVADHFLKEADALRAEGSLSAAREAYERVLRLDPGHARAAEGLLALQRDARHEKTLVEAERLFEQERFDSALERVDAVLVGNPQHRKALHLRNVLRDAKHEHEAARERDRLARSVLDARVTLQLRESTLRMAFEALSRSTQLNILVDKDVRQDAKITIYVRDVSVSDAIDLILLQNQLDKRVVNGNTILVYPANGAKQAEYEDLTIRSFRVTNADLKHLSGVLKTMLRLKEVAADEKTGILVVRDTPERLRLTERLIAAHDLPDPEIMLEVQVLEVSSSRSSNIGFKPPTSLTLTTPGSASAPLTLGQLNNLTSRDLLTSQLSAALNFKLEDGDVKTLASPRIRARSREKAKIMIGDRVPTVTNTVTPISTGSSVVTGTVTYQDVGLKLEFEPEVYSNSEVGIKLSLEVSNIAQSFTDANGSRSYQIGTRNASTNLRLKDGETQVLGGLISDQERNTASLVPGLGHLPIVGRLFGNNDGENSRSEIVLAITPRIVRDIPIAALESRQIFSGTVNSIRERPILVDPIPELRISGAVGAPNAGGGRGAPIAGAEGAGQPSGIAPSPPGQVLFNPASPVVPGAPVPAAGALLPPPPPLVVRPPVSR